VWNERLVRVGNIAKYGWYYKRLKRDVKAFSSPALSSLLLTLNRRDRRKRYYRGYGRRAKLEKSEPEKSAAHCTSPASQAVLTTLEVAIAYISVAVLIYMVI